MVSDATNFSGRWKIFEMEEWDRDYFDMDVKAYIEINRRKSGHFQFGLVCGEIEGRIEENPGGKRLEFTWEGNDECDHACGRGWLRMKENDLLEGEIVFHSGDSSMFLAKTAKTKGRARK
jgi:hypothetical protein